MLKPYIEKSLGKQEPRTMYKIKILDTYSSLSAPALLPVLGAKGVLAVASLGSRGAQLHRACVRACTLACLSAHRVSLLLNLIQGDTQWEPQGSPPLT